MCAHSIAKYLNIYLFLWSREGPWTPDILSQVSPLCTSSRNYLFVNEILNSRTVRASKLPQLFRETIRIHFNLPNRKQNWRKESFFSTNISRTHIDAQCRAKANVPTVLNKPSFGWIKICINIYRSHRINGKSHQIILQWCT